MLGFTSLWPLTLAKGHQPWSTGLQETAKSPRLTKGVIFLRRVSNPEPSSPEPSPIRRHLDDMKKYVPAFIPEFVPEFVPEFIPEFVPEFELNTDFYSGTNSGMNSGTNFFSCRLNCA